MPNRFDTIIEQARSRGYAHHEADPRSFGDPEMFRACLILVRNRFPDINISLSGPMHALSLVGATHGVAVPGARIGAQSGETDAPGFVRLTFIRRRAEASRQERRVLSAQQG